MAHTFTSVNPATGETAGTYSRTTAEEIDAAASQAVKAFRKWKEIPLGERAIQLKAIAKELRAQKEDLARLATLEMGKPVQQARDEVEKCARAFDFYAKEGHRFLADEPVETDARKSFISYQPLGVVLAIMPWNFPYWQAFRCMAPILMSGNTMLLKHASNVSGCALAIEGVLKKAGLPKGVFRSLLMPSAEIAGLIAHPAIGAVTFTGSTSAGSSVAEAAGRALKKQVLELGGSDAYIILEDADLKSAVEVCVNARLVNTGQSCVAAKRFIVVKSLRKEFEQLMTQKMEAAVYGDPMDQKSAIGPMARADLRDGIHQQVLASMKKGAKLLCGGFIPDGPGAFYPPTVLTNVKKGMPAYDEELFGPVAAIIEAKDEAHAIRLANDSIYGLGGAVFSKDRKRATALARNELEAGNCFVNESVHSDPRLPFGGVKHSGYGRELGGALSIREFTNIKTVFIK